MDNILAIYRFLKVKKIADEFDIKLEVKPEGFTFIIVDREISLNSIENLECFFDGYQLGAEEKEVGQ